MKLKFKERELKGYTKVYMTVLENILPTQRRLILVCQNYSVCLKNWPRAPELQGKEGEKETAGEEAALFRMLDLGISFSPK